MTGVQGVGWYRFPDVHASGGSAAPHARRPSARHGVAWTHAHRTRSRARRRRTRRADRAAVSRCRCVTALLIASGHLVWGVVGLTASGVVDLLDGSVAAAPRARRRPAARSSTPSPTASRTRCVFGGVAWYLGRDGGRGAVLALAAVALAMLISYERAKAEGLGYDARGGLMERAERMVLLGIGLAFDVLVPVLWIMVVLMADHRGAPVREGVAAGVRPPRPARASCRRATSGRADRRRRPRAEAVARAPSAPPTVVRCARARRSRP